MHEFLRTDDLYRVLPELVWCGFGVLVMLLQPFIKNRHFFTFLALVGAWLGTAAIVYSGSTAGPGFGGLIQADAFSIFFHALIGLVSFLVILAAGPYLNRENLPFAEFYGLLLFATAGMGVMASAQELLTAFIGLEMSSISSYILAGFPRTSSKSPAARTPRTRTTSPPVQMRKFSKAKRMLLPWVPQRRAP